MASEERISVKLLGGSPWGFRLTGGAGTGQPLIVNKIRRKSKAQHQLKEGDFILAINGVKCQTLTYDDAMNVVDEATDSLIIEILRAKQGKENVAPQPQTQPQRIAAKTTEIAPLNQKENYSVVENATKTFVEDQRLQSSSIQQQESSSSISQTRQIEQESKTTQIEQTAPTPKTSFFPQTKFSVPKPAEMVASQESTVQQFQQSQQVQRTFQQQETSRQTQFYQENFQHPQFQLPQKPHAPTQPLLPPVQHPEFPQPQSPAQSTAPQLQQLPPEPLYQMPPEPLYQMPPQQPSPQQQFQQQQQPQQLFQQQPAAQQQFEQQPSPQQLFPQQQPPPPHKLQQQPMEPLFQPQPSPFQVPLIGPTFNAKTSLLSSLPGPKPFQTSASGDIEAQREKTVSFEQTSDDKHFHQLKTEATRQKTDNSETQTFIREEQSFTTEGGGPTATAEDLKPEVETKPSKPVSSIIQDLEEATRDFNRVADAMSSTSMSNTSKSIESSSSLYQVSKFESKEATSVESHSMWRPTSPIFNQPIEPPGEFGGQTTQHDSTRDNVQSGEVSSDKVVPRPVPTKPKQRPISAPPMDTNIFDSAMQTQMSSQRFESSEFNESKISSSLSTSEFYSSSTATNPYQPSPEADEMGSTSLLSRRRKMYTSSSFYEEPGQIYPTVEEQVELCRKIADSLSADTNKKSKGANMFYKRVKRSHKWVHESGFDPYSSDGNTTDSERDIQTPDLASAPYIKVSKGPPKLKLIMAPREIIDMQKLRSSGQLVNEHNVISPDICMDIVRDLNSPRGRGAALFAKRKQRAEDWVVDEEKVKAKTEARKASMATLEQLADVFPPPVALNPRVKLIKSPWEAAMESPIGSCDAAFVELAPVVGNFMAHTIIQAAENKLASTSPEGFDQSTEYHPPGLKRPEPIYKPVAPVSIDIYRPKAPKGWKGTTQESVPTNRVEPELAPFAPQAAQPVTSSSGGAQSETGHQAMSRVPTTGPRPQSFHDFNTIPRSWTKVKSNPPNRTASFRPVQPPSTHF